MGPDPAPCTIVALPAESVANRSVFAANCAGLAGSTTELCFTARASNLAGVTAQLDAAVAELESRGVVLLCSLRGLVSDSELLVVMERRVRGLHLVHVGTTCLVVIPLAVM